MSNSRFQVTTISDIENKKSSSQSAEVIPLIHIENEIKGSNSQISTGFFGSLFQRKNFDNPRRLTNVTTGGPFNNRKKKFSLPNIPDAIETMGKNRSENETDESDVYSTIQSHMPNVQNKFLQEIRSKCRELQEKSKNMPIDQRIALNRKKQQDLKRAQDIFDVHFELNNADADLPLTDEKLFSEEYQVKIRNDIYNELNRQQIEQNCKHHRHLFLGRSLLLIMTSIFLLMSCILIYVVFDFYNRSNDLMSHMPNNDYVPMFDSKTEELY